MSRDEKNINTVAQTLSKEKIEENLIEVIKTIYDPEIPVNIWDLGLIYKLEVQDTFHVEVDMTLTAPNCPVADQIVFEVREKIKQTEGVASVEVNLVFEPPWYPDLMTEEAKLELGLL